MRPPAVRQETRAEVAVGEVACTSAGGFGFHGDQAISPAIRPITTSPATEAIVVRRLKTLRRGGGGIVAAPAAASDGAAGSAASPVLSPSAASAGAASMSSPGMRGATL